MAQVLTKSLNDNKDAGSPAVAFHTFRPGTLGSKDVLVRFLAAPINPLDVLVLADLYPVKPQHHFQGEPIIGYDGVGEIVFRGAQVTEVAPGDLVIPSKFGLGTWRTQAVVHVEWVQKIARPADIAFAAILRISIAPAYFLVEDMCDLKPGDWIIQNAATSVVAQMVVQFARKRGIHTIGVVRDRDAAEAEAVKQALHQLGSDIVVTESEVEGNAEIKSKRVKLALDSVFGASARRLVDTLSPGGTYVQLGFLGGPKGQLPLNATDIFGRVLTLKAFRGTSQMALRTPEEQTDMFNWFVSRFNDGELIMPRLGINRIDWDSTNPHSGGEGLLNAVKRAQKGELGQRKQVIIFK
ncbi:MAG: putative secondary metabolism biosynthetic enzyme [Bathelium mastoideum]|nr:MAG: putative secondary metabolism biosynthetic enzyme [Bathelium mastoideum]